MQNCNVWHEWEGPVAGVCHFWEGLFVIEFAWMSVVSGLWLLKKECQLGCSIDPAVCPQSSPEMVPVICTVQP